MRGVGIGGSGRFRIFGRVRPTPEQVRNSDNVEQMKLEGVEARQDAKYNAMTEQERQAYYVDPSLATKVKKFLRGR